MEKCNYYGKTSTCKGAYPEGCFFQNKVAEDKMSMNPEDFIEKYKDNDISNKGIAIAHGIGDKTNRAEL